MSLDYAIMGFLSEGDHSGYDLKTRCFDDEARHFWTADQAQVYRTLDRLERNSLVSARIVHQSGRPDRKVYRLTTHGREALDDWLSSPHEAPPYRDPFLIQLRFASDVSEEALVEILVAERASRQSRLEGLRHRLATHQRRTAKPSRRDELARMTIEAALTNERAVIDWLDDCIESVSAEREHASEEGQRRLFRTPSEPGGDVV